MALLAGATPVQDATGEAASDADHGGGELHAEVAGLADCLAEDDAHGTGTAREVVAGLG
ncbi:carboxyl transferase domain-containing protein [Cribrihabitans pelagius]|uniref:carboxyl transferase domain-containing protein n=1 Tax=Cribrihabitans pelagius TaxID=1765746 RepID=UPI003B599492